MITAQIIYKLQVLYKKQEIRKNNKYCLILVQICVPIFPLSQVFTADLFCCDFDSASFSWEGPFASCYPEALCHPIQNMWPLASEQDHWLWKRHTFPSECSETVHSSERKKSWAESSTTATSTWMQLPSLHPERKPTSSRQLAATALKLRWQEFANADESNFKLCHW